MWIAKINGQYVGRFYHTHWEAMEVWPPEVLVYVEGT